MLERKAVEAIFHILDAQGRRYDWFAAQLSKRTGTTISKSRVSRWKNGTRPIPSWFIEHSCTVLQMPESVIYSYAQQLLDSTASVLVGTAA